MQFLRTRPFDKAAESLDAMAQTRLSVKLRQFETDYNGGQSHRQLAEVYDFKLIRRVASCGRRSLDGEVYQLKPLGNYRVVLLLVTDDGKAYYVHVWRKKGQQDPEMMKSALARAENFIRQLANGD